MARPKELFWLEVKGTKQSKARFFDKKGGKFTQLAAMLDRRVSVLSDDPGATVTMYRTGEIEWKEFTP